MEVIPVSWFRKSDTQVVSTRTFQRGATAMLYGEEAGSLGQAVAGHDMGCPQETADHYERNPTDRRTIEDE
jgi:hypothetical protein